MKSGFGHGAALAAMVLMVPSGQVFAADKAVTPPPPVAPPAPVAAPPVLHPAPKMVAAPAPMPPQNYGPAPKAAAPTPPPKDGKIRKEQRRKKEADSANCLSKSVSVVGRPIIPLFTQGENSTTALRVTPQVGLAACDAVLALPADADSQWDRRAQLLQARATHLIALGAQDAALQSLDEADAIGSTRNDSLFANGLGVGNNMLRAYALGKQGKKEQALLVIAQTRAMRPYVTTIDRALDRLEHNLDTNIDAMLAGSLAKVKWQPDLMRFLLPLYIWRGNMADAGKIADDVSTINPKPIGGWTMSGTLSAARQLEDDVEMQLQRAYVWAALGDREKSDRIIAGTQSDIAEYVGKEPVADKGSKVPKYKMREYEERVATGKAVEMLVARWDAAIQLRLDTVIRPAEELMARAERSDVAGLIVGLDLMRNLKFSNPEDQSRMSNLVKQTDDSIARDILKLDVNTVRELLPEPEYLSDVPRFGKAGDGILFARENGVSQAKEKDSDIRTIRFGTTSGTGPMAEELSLLAAAQYAQQEGKDSFILLARRIIKRTTTVSGYYTAGYSYDSGYESQLRVILLDSKNLPAEWSAKRGRLIMADEVLAQIKPRYDAYETRKAALKK